VAVVLALALRPHLRVAIGRARAPEVQAVARGGVVADAHLGARRARGELDDERVSDGAPRHGNAVGVDLLDAERDLVEHERAGAEPPHAPGGGARDGPCGGVEREREAQALHVEGAARGRGDVARVGCEQRRGGVRRG
jgi:hypothetical protein